MPLWSSKRKAASVCKVAPPSGLSSEVFLFFAIYRAQFTVTDLKGGSRSMTNLHLRLLMKTSAVMSFSVTGSPLQRGRGSPCDNDATVSASRWPTYHLPPYLTLPFTAFPIIGSLLCVIWASEVGEPWPNVESPWTCVRGSYGCQ